MFISVVFPAPFSPSRARISPWWMSRSMASLATRAPKRFVTPTIDRTTGEDCMATRVCGNRSASRSARLGFGVVHINAEQALDNLLFFVLDDLCHIRRHQSLIHSKA